MTRRLPPLVATTQEMADRDFHVTIYCGIGVAKKPCRWTIQRKSNGGAVRDPICANGVTDWLGEAEQAVIDAIHDLRREAKRKAKR
jgi:hypothetical protein